MIDSDIGLHLFSEEGAQKTAAAEKPPENVSAFPEGIELVPLIFRDSIYFEAGLGHQFLPGSAAAEPDVNASPFSGR